MYYLFEYIINCFVVGKKEKKKNGKKKTSWCWAKKKDLFNRLQMSNGSKPDRQLNINITI